MATLSPRVRQAVSMTALTLLDKLVTAVGVRYCTHCFFPGDECRCPVWSPTPTTTLTPTQNHYRPPTVSCRPNGTPDASLVALTEAQPPGYPVGPPEARQRPWRPLCGTPVGSHPLLPSDKSPRLTAIEGSGCCCDEPCTSRNASHGSSKG